MMSEASSYSSSSSPTSLKGLRLVMRLERRKGSGGTFCCCAAALAALAFCSWRLRSEFASVRILLAKHRSRSWGIHTWPLGRTRSPARLVRHIGWFSASATGFISRMSPAAWRMICCTTCDLCAKYIS